MAYPLYVPPQPSQPQRVYPLPTQPAASLPLYVPPILPDVKPITDRVYMGKRYPVVDGMIQTGLAKPLPTTLPFTPLKTDKPKLDTNLIGQAFDLSKAVGGALLATRPTQNPYELTGAYQRWRSQTLQQAGQGLQPDVLKVANDGINQTYRQGVGTLTNAIGGGANPGVALAGMTRLGMQKIQQQQELAAQNEAMKRANARLYGEVAQNDLMFGRQQWEEQQSRTAAVQSAGMNAVQQGLKGMQDRQTFDALYGPGSAQAKLMEAQIKREEASIEYMKTVAERIAKQAK